MQNNIPVFCPGLTDGSLGDMLYFHSFRNPGLIIDIIQGRLLLLLLYFTVLCGDECEWLVFDYLERIFVCWDVFFFVCYHISFFYPRLTYPKIWTDIRAVNGEAIHASPRKTGMIILGGGLPKHHICNANMMRNGADYALFINTAQEFDGSDSGARPDEAVSWGKIRGSAKTVKVCPFIPSFQFHSKVSSIRCNALHFIKVKILIDFFVGKPGTLRCNNRLPVARSRNICLKKREEEGEGGQCWSPRELIGIIK